MYRALDAALVRAAAHAGDIDLPTWPDITGGVPINLESCRDWLRQVWSDESYADAIAVASPVLARQVSRACDGECGDPRRMRRTVVSVARYLLRMTGRSTPFGLFAGVAAARFGPRPVTRWGEQHRAVVRADAVWLASLITRLEECPQLVRQLPVVVNNLCTVRGERLILPIQEQAGGSPDAAGQTVLTDISVRHTRAVEAAVRYACEPIELSDLAGKLASDFPRTSPTVIEAMLADLVKLRVLLTGLRPPMTVTDGLGHVVAQLRAVDADAIPQIADQVLALYAIDDEIARHNRATASRERSDRRIRLVELMRQVSSTIEQPIMIDLHLDLDVTLPDTLARDAETAAAALTRLTPYPWAVIELVHRAITVLEELADGQRLFPREFSKAPKPRTYLGDAMTPGMANERIARFTGWANTLAGAHGRQHETIPDDPAGAVTMRRLRRTVAWFINRQPGGRIALGIQYGHLRASLAESYGGRSTVDMLQILDLEQALATADALSEAAERLNTGEGVSGPAAARYIAAAAQFQAAYPGGFVSKRQHKALLDNPRLQVFDHPQAMLTCNHDPLKALCDPNRGKPASAPKRTPSPDRCHPACANISRTDTHIGRVQAEIDRIGAEITDGLAPHPIRQRLLQRRSALEQIITRHEATRIHPDTDPGRRQ